MEISRRITIFFSTVHKFFESYCTKNDDQTVGVTVVENR